MRDLHSHIGIVQAIGPAVFDADTTPAAIDLGGFESAEILIAVGAGGITFTDTNRVDFVVTHGATEDGTFESVTTEDVLGATVATGGIVQSLTAAHAAPTATKVGYVGGRRFLKVLADFEGTHAAGTPIAVTVVKGHPHAAPVA